MIVIIRTKKDSKDGLLIQTNKNGADVYKYVTDFESELGGMKADIDITAYSATDVLKYKDDARKPHIGMSKKVNRDSKPNEPVAESRYSRKSEPFVVVNELLRRKR